MTEFVCPMCSENNWDVVYSGPVRDGEFSTTYNLQKSVIGEIIECSGCKVQKLVSRGILKFDDYKLDNYRNKLKQEASDLSYIENHKHHLKFILNLIQKSNFEFKNKKIADIGAASGAFLELISETSSGCIAIEPNQSFGRLITEKGYPWYEDTEQALINHKHTVDLAVSVHVVEHVNNPKHFLRNIYEILRPGGNLFLTTPNRDDILMSIYPNNFRSFFYRTQHNWYFDKDSLEICAKLAGFEQIDVGYAHKYPIANAVTWGARSSKTQLEEIDASESVNCFWRNYLQSIGKADTLVLTAQKAKEI